MDTITLWLLGKRRDKLPAKYRAGFPYYGKSVYRVSKKITFVGEAAVAMREYKRDGKAAEENFDRAGVLADFLEERPELCLHPDRLPLVIKCLRAMFAERKLAYELGY